MQTATNDSGHVAVPTESADTSLHTAMQLKQYDTSGNESEHGCFVLYTEHVRAVQAAYSAGVDAMASKNQSLELALEFALKMMADLRDALVLALAK